MDTKNHLKTAIEEFKQMSGILLEDVSLHTKAYFDNPSQIAARALIRAIFAMIEGETYGLKQWALGQYRRTGKLTDPGELALLEEVAFDLSENGKVTKRAARIRTVANVRFALEAFARSFDYSYNLDPNQLGWKAFKDSLDVRHRLTHPKGAKDLHVNDDEVVVAEAAAEWFHHSVTELLIECVRKMVAVNVTEMAGLHEIEMRWKESSRKSREILMSGGPKKGT